MADGTVEIDVGMDLLNLFLGEERQLKQLVHGGRIDVEGLVVELFQFFQPGFPGFVLGVLLVIGVCFQEVLPGVDRQRILPVGTYCRQQEDQATDKPKHGMNYRPSRSFIPSV